MSPDASKKTEFYEWLDECPVLCFRVAEYPDFVSYNFVFEEEEEDVS